MVRWHKPLPGASPVSPWRGHQQAGASRIFKRIVGLVDDAKMPRQVGEPYPALEKLRHAIRTTRVESSQVYSQLSMWERRRPCAGDAVEGGVRYDNTVTQPEWISEKPLPMWRIPHLILVNAMDGHVEEIEIVLRVNQSYT